MREYMDMLVSAMKKGLVNSFGPDMLSEGHTLSFESIAADGSTRRFFRIVKGNQPICLAVFPGDDSETAKLEANAVHRIGRHLYSCQIAVPKIFCFDDSTGMVMMEDLGDKRLYDHVQTAKSAVQPVYERVIDTLLSMQFAAVSGFDVSWCYDTKEYDRKLMIERESRYFERAYLNDLLGLDSPEGLDREFEILAEHAAAGTMRCFLHRDLQSRNIMVYGDKIGIIDFQGGRIGPPGYDLASLLNDPYAGLDPKTKKVLYAYYIKGLSNYVDGDCREFEKTYPYLALQRNLQIIGAFSFLYKQRRKVFFKQFILPALLNLQTLLMYTELQQFTILYRAVNQSMALTKRVLVQN